MRKFGVFIIVLGMVSVAALCAGFFVADFGQREEALAAMALFSIVIMLGLVAWSVKTNWNHFD